MIHEDTRAFTFFRQNMPLNLIQFLAYLPLLAGPIMLVSLSRLRKIISKRLFFGVVFLSIGLSVNLWSEWSPSVSGEMQYGFLDFILPVGSFGFFRAVGFFFSIVFLIVISHDAIKGHNRFAQFILWLMIPYLVAISCIFPAQRYLLPCLPFVLYYLIIEMGKYERKSITRLGYLTVVTYSVLTLLGTMYQIEQGKAADKMVRWVVANGYLEATSVVEGGDSIYTHLGNRFYSTRDLTKKYTISVNRGLQYAVLHREQVLLFGTEIKTYYFYPLVPDETEDHSTQFKLK